jgi:tetratricopeptide (TPR) repeat protein
MTYHGKRNTCIVILFVFLFVVHLTGLAQDIEQQLQLAEKLQRSEQWKEARAVYEKLYQQAPDRMDIFQRFLDCCLKLKDFNRAMELVLDWQEKTPNDRSLLVSKAELHAKLGNREEAVIEWRKALNLRPRDLSLYQRVASSMTREHYYEEAENVYLLARKQFSNDNLFALNLSNLYAAQIEYGKATSELIAHLFFYPKQISLVESCLRRYPRTKRVYHQVTDQLKRAILENPKKQSLRQVLIHYYLHMGAYQNALDETLTFESFEEPENQGHTLFQFAQRAFRIGALLEAETAFLTVLQKYGHFRQKDRVLEGLAQCYRAQNRLKETIDTYQKLNKEYPRSSLAREALYQIAIIQKNSLFHFLDAEKTFQTIIRQWPQSTESVNSQMQLGECYIGQGKLQEAEQVFQKIKEHEEKKHGKLWLHALIGLAEVLYLKGDFLKAISELDQLSAVSITGETMQDPRLNDGLKLRLFLKEYARSSQEALLLFSKSAYLYRQRKLNRALFILDSLKIQWPEDPIVPYVLFKKGELGIELDLPKVSLASYDTLVNRYPGHLLADQALERKGWIKEKQGDKKEAFRIYESLLMQYPHSLLANEIRDRIRRLENGMER